MQWYKGITLDDNVYFRGLYNGVWGDWYQVASREWVTSQNYITSNQTITLSGDVTGSGTTLITTAIATNAVTTSKIANTAVTFAKFQNINTNRLLGRSSAGSGSVEELSIGTGLSLSGGTLSASGGGGSAVWKVQGGSTDATTNTEDIYHNARVKIGNSVASSFQLSVSGQGYFSTGTIINNSNYYQVFNSSVTAVNALGMNSSNQHVLGASGYDILLPAYTSSRSADTIATTDKHLYVNSSGLVKIEKSEGVRNDGVSLPASSSQTFTAGGGAKKLKFNNYSILPAYYTVSGSSGDYDIYLPNGSSKHLFLLTFEYTTTGTPTIQINIRINTSSIKTYTIESDASRNIVTVHYTASANWSSNYVNVQLTVTGSNITVDNGYITVTPLGTI